MGSCSAPRLKALGGKELPSGRSEGPWKGTWAWACDTRLIPPAGLQLGEMLGGRELGSAEASDPGGTRGAGSLFPAEELDCMNANSMEGRDFRREAEAAPAAAT